MNDFPTVKLPPKLTKKKKKPTVHSYNSWDVERDRSEDYYQTKIRKDDETISKTQSSHDES